MRDRAFVERCVRVGVPGRERVGAHVPGAAGRVRMAVVRQPRVGARRRARRAAHERESRRGERGEEQTSHRVSPFDRTPRFEDRGV